MASKGKEQTLKDECLPIKENKTTNWTIFLGQLNKTETYVIYVWNQADLVLQSYGMNLDDSIKRYDLLFSHCVKEVDSWEFSRLLNL